MTTTTPGQNARLTFNGTTGQRVSVTSSNNTIAQSTFSLVKPNGSNLFSGPMYGGANGFMDVQTLPDPGTYTLLVDPGGSNTGSVTLRLYDVPADVTGSITPGGAPVSVTMTVPGQNARLTFSGTVGQRVSVASTNNTISSSTFSLLKPDGSSLFSGSMSGGFNGFMDVQTLPLAGAYTLLVDPAGTSTGSVTLTLYDVPADPTASTTIGGAPATLTLATPGQNGTVTFAGSAGQQATVRLTGNTIGYTGVTLRKPDGSSLTSASWWDTSFNLVTQTLPTTGTYTIFVDPIGANAGGITVAVTSP